MPYLRELARVYRATLAGREGIMADDSAAQKFIPALAWYRPFEPFAYAFIRFSTGALIVPHGVDRLFYGGSRADLGGFLASFPASAIGTCELVGGVLIALGLLTRPVALLLAIEWIAIAVAMPMRPGASWLMLGATGHHAAFVAGLCIAFVLRGGGTWSLDRVLGKEF
jgi:putative oxidoreductase